MLAEDMAHYFDELKTYLKFDASDQELLRQFRPHAKHFFDTITHDFYDRIKRHPEALTVFRSEEQVLRLRATLANWMDKLLSGPWDEEYFKMRDRIGAVHVAIGLPQHYMFSAMGVIQEHLMGIANETLKDDVLEATIVAIQKITNIDLAIMLESYREDVVKQVQLYERNESKQLANQLEQTQALYRSLFESSGVAIAIVGVDGRIQLFNAMAERLTGFSRREVVGENFATALIHPVDQGNMSELLDCARQDTSICAPQELRVISSDHSDKWVRWHVSAIADTGDTCVLGVDVTSEHKLAEKSKRVETLASLGTLAAGLAHEIRNPLNAAQLQLMLVERAVSRAGDSVDKRALESSALVKAELSRLAGLVEDFLAFARPNELRIANADISALCEGIAVLVGGEATERGVQFTCDIQSDVYARVDGGRLKQVLLNLLRNAVDAAGESGGVELHCKRIAQSIFFEVVDSGPGVPPDIEIFEPFATSKEGGTGLGLPIVARIISDHGGNISFERRAEQTVFHVELPIDGPESD